MPVPAVVNPARGTTLKHGVSGTYTALAQVVSIDGPAREVGTRETTILTSTAKTFDVSLFDCGELSGKLLYDPQSDSHQILEGLMTTPVLAQWELALNDATNGTTGLQFLGILTKFSPTGIEVEANLEAEFTIKGSGTVTVVKPAV